MTGSAYEKILDTDGDSIPFTSGKSVAVVINATTADGSRLTEPTATRVR